MRDNLCVPQPRQALSEEIVWRWYNNISLELEMSFLDQREKAYLSAYYKLAGLLKGWRRSFFYHHYSRTFAQAATFLLKDVDTPRILDLGGGTGTQSLFLALIGASVVVLDMDQMSLRILKKRQAFYEEISGRKLDVKAICANAFQFDYGTIAPIDGLYSLFAFNMIQPSRKLLDLLFPHMSRGSRVVVQDGNRSSWVSKVFPCRRRDVLSPLEFESELENQDFEIVSHSGGVVFPPVFWMVWPTGLLRSLDEKLGHNWLMPVSHQIMAIKQMSK